MLNSKSKDILVYAVTFALALLFVIVIYALADPDQTMTNIRAAASTSQLATGHLNAKTTPSETILTAYSASRPVTSTSSVCTVTVPPSSTPGTPLAFMCHDAAAQIGFGMKPGGTIYRSAIVALFCSGVKNKFVSLPHLIQDGRNGVKDLVKKQYKDAAWELRVQYCLLWRTGHAIR